jgi:hypothetical protein
MFADGIRLEKSMENGSVPKSNNLGLKNRFVSNKSLAHEGSKLSLLFTNDIIEIF